MARRGRVAAIGFDLEQSSARSLRTELTCLRNSIGADGGLSTAAQPSWRTLRSDLEQSPPRSLLTELTCLRNSIGADGGLSTAAQQSWRTLRSDLEQSPARSLLTELTCLRGSCRQVSWRDAMLRDSSASGNFRHAARAVTLRAATWQHGQEGTLRDTDIYPAIGEEGFGRLIAAFYRQVPDDDILAPMYPAHDLAGAEKRLRDFLVGRFGGPQRYIEQRGHPRLRARHMPFVIDAAASARWLQLMDNALRETALPAEVDATLRDFFQAVAISMQNG